MSDASPIAVVVGLCAHGLAITRSLHRANVTVMALEVNKDLPGTRTNAASVQFVEDINGPGLISSLVSLAPRISEGGPPILFLTNDTMIRTVAEDFESLQELYKVSWSSCRNRLLPLLSKEHVESHCRRAVLDYPASRLIHSKSGLASIGDELRFPIIFKPTRPLSQYKTLIAERESDLHGAWHTIKQSTPAIAQEFVPGDDSCIQFAALYLKDGDIVARYEGRKLRSRPMGHTTVAIGEESDHVHELCCRFFDGLNFSGPVSLEVKVDRGGRYWVIEPTVGRTDFWLGLCIGDGVDFPLIEYRSLHSEHQDVTYQRERKLWVNGDRDPAAVIWLILRYPVYLFSKRIAGVFLDWRDIKPYLASIASRLQSLPGHVMSKLRRMIRPSDDIT